MSLSPLLQKPPLFSFSTSASASPRLNDGTLFHFSNTPDEDKFVGSPLQTRQPAMAQGPQDDLQMQCYQLKMEYSQLERRYNAVVIELKTTKDNFDKLLETIKQAPAHTPNPTTALLYIPTFSRSDYPCITIWTKDDFTKADSIRSSKGVSLKNDSCSSLLWWIQDADGRFLDAHTISCVREWAKLIWQRLKVQGRAPPRFLDADINVINEFNHYMINQFLFLGFCDNFWKTRQIFVIDYPSWYSKHVKNSKGGLTTQEDHKPSSSRKCLHSEVEPRTDTKHIREDSSTTLDTISISTLHVTDTSSLIAPSSVVSAPLTVSSASSSLPPIATAEALPIIASSAANTPPSTSSLSLLATVTPSPKAPPSPLATLSSLKEASPSLLGPPLPPLLATLSTPNAALSSLSPPHATLLLSSISPPPTATISSIPITTDPNSPPLNLPSMFTGVFNDSTLAASLVPLPPDPTAVAPPKKEREARESASALLSILTKREWIEELKAGNQKPTEDEWKKYWAEIHPERLAEYKERSRNLLSGSTNNTSYSTT
ncbi:hypothetical protein F5876DRAFT_78704 [Lentinula aff. lateritia]|uniref:Uncharacterized protein n=1 Tax=Lentinula aff. lateritia TaxID=2804960 RepID=A0ACC1TV11_9AGAR|nr:hypothetical protein F5876DRAFT_78704 [Lentinula aff. lateritia]